MRPIVCAATTVCHMPGLMCRGWRLTRGCRSLAWHILTGTIMCEIKLALIISDLQECCFFSLMTQAVGTGDVHAESISFWVQAHALEARLTKMYLMRSCLHAGRVMVGPVSPRPARAPDTWRATAPEVYDFLSSAPSDVDVVLVGFGGTGVFGQTMSPEDFIELAAGFSSLAPTRVLLAMSKTNLPGNLTLEELPLRDNVKIVSWVDYNDVLGHPSVKVFMTHCGVHSMMEAAFHGVAVVGIPFQFEQKENCGKLVSAGMGEMATQAVAFRRRDPKLRFTRNHVEEVVRKVRMGWMEMGARWIGGLILLAALRILFLRENANM